MYKVILTDVNNLPKSCTLSGGKLSDILSQHLSPKYKGLRCFFYETDHDHHSAYFLSDVEDVSFKIGTDGFNVRVKLNKKGIFTGYGDIFYQLTKNKISKETLDNLVKKKVQMLGSITHQTDPEIELLPPETRDYATSLECEIFLIRNGENFIKV